METHLHREPWNKGIMVGQKAPLKLKEVWAIRMRLQLADRQRELALFNLGADSKLRARDLVQLRVKDICHDDHVASRAIVMQQTHRPVQIEITEPTREALTTRSRPRRFVRMIGYSRLGGRLHTFQHVNTREQFIVGSWSWVRIPPRTERTR